MSPPYWDEYTRQQIDKHVLRCHCTWLHKAKLRVCCGVQDLTSSERDYIRRKLGPDNYNWAKAALKMADKMGPISGGEIFHDCDCMEFSCFCGKVKHLGDPDDSVSEGVGQEAGSDSDWTTCSEDEFEELQKESCPYNEQLGDCCSPTCQVDPASQKLSAMCL